MSIFRVSYRFVASQSQSNRYTNILFQGQELLNANSALSPVALLINNNAFSSSSGNRNISNKCESRTAVVGNLLSTKLLQQDHQPNNGELNNGCKILPKKFLHQQQLYQLQQFRQLSLEHIKQTKMTENKEQRITTHVLTKNLTLLSNKPRYVALDKKTMTLKESINSPLVVVFSWLLAKKKHLQKYAKIYTDQGFDVLTIEITPWQLLWPTKGSQLIANDVLNFLDNNTSFSPIVIHGFSVGGYVWGEVLVKMAQDLPKYQNLLDKIGAQIWDSAADITEIPVGVPKAIFPKNRTLQNTLRGYLVYHMKTFHNVATVHYIRSSQLFHHTILKAPSLFLVSKTDPIGTVKANTAVKESMELSGLKTVWKCWDKSPHVLHYQYHPEEYVEAVYKHLNDTNVLNEIAEKKRAKL